MQQTKQIYFGRWSCLHDLLKDFYQLYEWDDNYQKSIEKLKQDFSNKEILFAWYSYEDYNGEAVVIFKENGKLYEVRGSHCSCYGLEDQWQPEETFIEALKHMNKDSWYNYKTDLQNFLDSYTE
jgi:hypothetical protein